jgi:hypothetical protein
VWITAICTVTKEALMVRRNAPLTETGRPRLARCVAEERLAAAPGTDSGRVVTGGSIVAR